MPDEIPAYTMELYMVNDPALVNPAEANPDNGDFLKSKTDVYCRYLDALEAARRERFNNTRVFAVLSLQTVVGAFLVAKFNWPSPFLLTALIVGVLVSACWAVLSRAARGHFRLKLDTARALELELPLRPISTEAYYLKAKDIEALYDQARQEAGASFDPAQREIKLKELDQHYKILKAKALSQRNHRFDQAESWLPWVPAGGFALAFVLTLILWL